MSASFSISTLTPQSVDTLFREPAQVQCLLPGDVKISSSSVQLELPCCFFFFYHRMSLCCFRWERCEKGQQIILSLQE
jgi:hypothetical protein